jgi:hypothetical protein
MAFSSSRFLFLGVEDFADVMFIDFPASRYFEANDDINTNSEEAKLGLPRRPRLLSLFLGQKLLVA